MALCQTDRNFYDRCFFNGYAPDGSVLFALAHRLFSGGLRSRRARDRLACRRLFTPLVSAVSFKRTPRSDKMFLTLLRRLCRQSIDLDSLANWE